MSVVQEIGQLSIEGTGSNQNQSDFRSGGPTTPFVAINRDPARFSGSLHEHLSWLDLGSGVSPLRQTIQNFQHFSHDGYCWA